MVLGALKIGAGLQRFGKRLPVLADHFQRPKLKFAPYAQVSSFNPPRNVVQDSGQILDAFLINPPPFLP